jgi:hypothetical protein
LVLKKILEILLFVLGIAITMEFAGGATAEVVLVPQAGWHTGAPKLNGQ